MPMKANDLYACIKRKEERSRRSNNVAF